MKSQDDLKSMSVKELRAIAAAIGIAEAAGLKKSEIIDTLLSAGSPDGGSDPSDGGKEGSFAKKAKFFEKKAENSAGEEIKKKRGRPPKAKTPEDINDVKGAADGSADGSPDTEKHAAEDEPSPESNPAAKKRGRPKKIKEEDKVPEEKAKEPDTSENLQAFPPVSEQQAPADTVPFPPKPQTDQQRGRNRFGGDQRSDGQQQRREFNPDYDRRNGNSSYGGQQYQDKRQNGYDSQYQRQGGMRQQGQRQQDQKNQNGRYQGSYDSRSFDQRGRQGDQRYYSDQLQRRDNYSQRQFSERQTDQLDYETARTESVARDQGTESSDYNETNYREIRLPEEEKEFDCYGILEINQNGYGFLRAETLYPGTKDIFVPPPLIRRHLLRTGDMIAGKAKLQPKEYNAQFALCSVADINGIIAENIGVRPTFDTLVPTYPDEQLILETTRQEYATRIIDMFAPIGKGQRGLIVSPPKAGKTVLMKTIANAITKNYPDIHLIMLLIDERPEEVTDIKESVNAMVVASTFDEMTSRHVAVSEFCLEHAMRMVEMREDVVILMDSITRLARAYNQEVTPSGRSLSGGLDPAALYKPKKFFGAARNIKGGGSLTIIATALVDTGSRLDDVIYEEFKGTGNMELHLDRSLAERRIFPSIDITLSGTRKEELLLPRTTLDKVYALRRAFSNVNSAKDITEAVIENLAKTESNSRFLSGISV